MKKLLIATAAVASLVAGSAFAQDVSVTINGTVDKACVVPQINETVSIDLESMIDSNGFINGGDGQFHTIGDLGALYTDQVWCNTASKVTVSGTRMVQNTYSQNTGTYGLPNGFTHTIPMRLQNFNYGGAFGVSWGANDLNTGTTLDIEGGQPGTEFKNSAGAFAGNVSGQLQIWNADRRPIAGDYTAIWTLTVAPN